MNVTFSALALCLRLTCTALYKLIHWLAYVFHFPPMHSRKVYVHGSMLILTATNPRTEPHAQSSSSSSSSCSFIASLTIHNLSIRQTNEVHPSLKSCNVIFFHHHCHLLFSTPGSKLIFHRSFPPVLLPFHLVSKTSLLAAKQHTNAQNKKHC